MKLVQSFAFLMALAIPACGDFSYTTTRQAVGGAMAGVMGGRGGGPQSTKIFYKGQKMKRDDGNTATIMDFDAQTITTVSHTQKTYTVRRFSDIAEGKPAGDINMTVDVKETGQTQNINGFNCREVVMTVDADMQQARQAGKMRIEMDMWISSDVPGSGELHKFYQRNAASMPWRSLAGGNQPGMGAAMAEMQKKMASITGVQVRETVRVKPLGGAAPAGMSPAQSAQMDQARAKLEAMQAQGGPAAAMAAQALARMGGAGAGAAGGGGSMVEMTMESSGFSNNSVAESEFAIPAGYEKTN